MKIKRYFAKDIKTALLQVKEELGANAVIMSNKKVAGGVELVAAIDSDSIDNSQIVNNNFANNGNNIRLSKTINNNNVSEHSLFDKSSINTNRSLLNDTINLSSHNSLNNSSLTQRFANILQQYKNNEASDSYKKTVDNNSLAALLKRQEHNNQSSSSFSDHYKANYEQSPLAKLFADNDNKIQASRSKHRYDNKHDKSSSQHELNLMHQELLSIRQLLEHQVSGLMWQEVERKEPLRAMLIKRLERMGISSDLADQIVCYIPEDTKPAMAWKTLLTLLADQIPSPNQDILKRGGIVALLGPTGVGKTTSIAKLAARAAMLYGPDDVALITTDTYRIGAHEQLSIYSRIIGCPVRVAKDPEELSDIILQLKNRKLILIDTAGMGQRDVRLSEQLNTLIQNSGETIHSYLVLPATAQRMVLQETLDHFKKIPLSGCILTKLDESLSLGEFISVVIQNALPVVYVAHGQRVPEDIVMAQPKYILAKANELLEQSKENEPHFWSSSEEF